jgi:hypothetical protein
MEENNLHTQEVTSETRTSHPVKPYKVKPMTVLRFLISIINGSFLAKEYSIKQAPYVMFLFGVGMVYIANSYYAERKLRDIAKASSELKEMRSEYITSKSRLMYLGRQSVVARLAADKGLVIKESLSPPKKIIVEPTNQ